jgi:hypothetical protein
MSTVLSASERIRALNDAFRTAGPAAGDWMLTCGVRALGPDFVILAIRCVPEHTDFTADNDPYGEHDFGSFEVDGQRLFWKIDHYDRELVYGSNDPADPAVTRRVMTIMLAEDY